MKTRKYAGWTDAMTVGVLRICRASPDDDVLQDRVNRVLLYLQIRRRPKGQRYAKGPTPMQRANEYERRKEKRRELDRPDAPVP